MNNILLGAGALMLVALPAWAAPLTLQLTAGNTLAQSHSHAVFVSVTGTFQELTGQLDFDPVAGTCHIDVTLVVESMRLPNALVRSQTMSPDFLDPAKYPTQHYVGDCRGGTLVGELTMRGQTHPFDMAITEKRAGGQLTGLHLEGALNRYDWGLVGHGMIIGKMIQVTNDISLNGQPPGA
jgi:polyisoprenoid-binding protein YceI